MIEKEKLSEENIQLKKKIEEIREAHKFEKLKMNRLNEEFTKIKAPLKSSIEKTNFTQKNNSKTSEDFEALKSTMRNQYRDLNDKYIALKEQLKQKDEKVFYKFYLGKNLNRS